MRSVPLVVHVVPWVSHGGVERRRLVLARGLGPEFRQEVVCLGAREPILSELKQAGCPVTQVSPGDGVGARLDARSLARAVSIIRAKNPAIVHGAVFEGVTIAALAGKASGARTVIEETSCPDRRSWRGDLLIHLYARMADRVVAVSPAVTDYLRRRVHPPRRKLVELINGIDTPLTPSRSELERERERLGLVGHSVVGSIGRVWDEVKRFSLLIRALPDVLAQGLKVKLLLVGDGPDLERLRTLATELGVGDFVVTPGYRRDVGTMLALMDLFALTSRTESFALVLVEAMLTGVPVVATEVGGVPFVVGDAGVLLPANVTAGALGQRLVQLLGSRSTLTELGARGRARATERFGSGRYVAETAAMYRALLRG